LDLEFRKFGGVGGNFFLKIKIFFVCQNVVLGFWKWLMMLNSLINGTLVLPFWKNSILFVVTSYKIVVYVVGKVFHYTA